MTLSRHGTFLLFAVMIIGFFTYGMGSEHYKFEKDREERIQSKLSQFKAYEEEAATSAEKARDFVILHARAGNGAQMVRWLEIAGKLVDGEAAYDAACEFTHRLNVSKDEAKALQCLELANQHGYPRAKRLWPEAKANGLKAVISEMTIQHRE